MGERRVAVPCSWCDGGKRPRRPEGCLDCRGGWVVTEEVAPDVSEVVAACGELRKRAVAIDATAAALAADAERLAAAMDRHTPQRVECDGLVGWVMPLPDQMRAEWTHVVVTPEGDTDTWDADDMRRVAVANQLGAESWWIPVDDEEPEHQQRVAASYLLARWWVKCLSVIEGAGRG